MFALSQETFEDATSRQGPVDLTARHSKLAEAFEHDPCHAMVLDEAETGFVPAHVTLYSQVRAGEHDHAPIDVGVHERVGGNHDFANPGELLCASIAACYDTCIRLICRRLGIELTHLKVKVSGHVDVRGTLKLNPETPVGFQGFHVHTDIGAGPDIPASTMRAILKAAEDSCVVMQTIQNGPTFELDATINKDAA